jgi:hypothetical protein
MDLWDAVGSGSTFLDMTPYSATGAFDYDDLGNACSPVPFEVSSDPFGGVFALRGAPILTSPPGALGATGIVLERSSRICLPPPHEVATLQLEVKALTLVGIEPLTITWDFGNYTDQWDVLVTLSSRPQPVGSMTLTGNGCPEEGGSFSAVLPFLPRIAFVRRPPDPPCTISYDFGVSFFPPVVLAIPDGHWATTATPSLIETSLQDIQFDRNGDGAVAPDEPHLPPTSAGFYPGLRTLRCDRDSCEPAAGPLRRTVVANAAELTIALLRTEDESLQQDQDLDQVFDGADDCPSSADPGQLDGDGDGVGDACDNCPAVCDPDQADTDADLIGDACDCPAGGPPAEVQTLRFAPDRMTISWPAVPAATSYEVVRGSVSALPVGTGGGDEVCLGPVAASMIVDGAAPVGDQGFFYLVRARNACETGPLGYRDEHGIRTSPARTSTCP